MTKCTSIIVPMNAKTKLQRDIGATSVDLQLYRSLVGGLLHATISSWNIHFIINHVSRYLTNPQHDHMVAAKNIL
jgi:hypothetical protein